MTILDQINTQRGERIKLLRIEIYGQQTPFSAAVEVSKATISQWEHGGKIDIENLYKIQKATGVNLNWLITGEGNMRGDTLDAVINLDPSSHETPNPLAFKERIITITETGGRPNIEMVSSPAAASYISNLQAPEFVSDLPKLMIPDNVFRGGTFRAFQVEGRSMQPTILHGSWVIGRFVGNVVEDIKDGQIYIVVTDNSILIKRVLNRLKERGYLWVYSDNKEKEDKGEILYDQIREVWLLKGELRFDFSDIQSSLVDEVRVLRTDVDRVMNILFKKEAN